MDLEKVERNTWNASNSLRAISTVIVYGFLFSFVGTAIFVGGLLFASRDNDLYNSAMAFGALVFVGGNFITFAVAATTRLTK